MPRIISVQLDDETDALVEHDRKILSEASGEDLTISQYLRMILAGRIAQPGTVNPEQQGWNEGLRAGYAAVMRDFSEVMARLREEDGRRSD